MCPIQSRMPAAIRYTVSDFGQDHFCMTQLMPIPPQAISVSQQNYTDTPYLNLQCFATKHNFA